MAHASVLPDVTVRSRDCNDFAAGHRSSAGRWHTLAMGSYLIAPQVILSSGHHERVRDDARV